MSIKTRRIIFYILLLLFPLMGGVVLLYSDGWRVDLQNFTIVKTGGIYIYSKPSDAEIIIDGKYVANASSLISRGTLISGLLPKDYEVIVKKEGYSIWKKKVHVKPSLVTELSHIILVPEKSNLMSLKTPVAEISVSKDKLAIKSSGGLISIDEKVLPGTQFIATNANNSAAITFDKKLKSYFFVSLPNANASINLSLLFNNLKARALNLPGTVLPIEVLPHPFNPPKVIVRTKHGLYIMDTSRLTITVLAAGDTNIETVLVRDQSIFWIEYSQKERKSSLMSADLIILTPTRLATITAQIKKIEEITKGRFLLLDQDNNLRMLQNNLKEAEILEKNVSSFVVAPLKNRFITLTPSGPISLWDLEDEPRQLKLPVEAEEVFWHKDGAHIIAKRGSTVFLIELFENGETVSTVISNSATSAAYNSLSNLLYVLENKTVRLVEL